MLVVYDEKDISDSDSASDIEIDSGRESIKVK